MRRLKAVAKAQLQNTRIASGRDAAEQRIAAGRVRVIQIDAVEH